MNNFKVAATVILYNPEDAVYDNISSYASEIGKLIIVDNSTQHNSKLIKKLKNNFDNIEYIDNNANVGIATALNQGCDLALSLGFDWILTMDQDSRFLQFQKYISCVSQLHQKQNIALVAANTMWHTDQHKVTKNFCNYEKKFLVITSGNLLNLTLFNKIGRFEDKLFIDMVDHDYCLKAHKQGYEILFFENIAIEHSLGELYQRKNIFTGKIRNKIEHSPQRVYYITRNYFYTWKTYHKIFPKEFNLLKTINILFIHEVTKILIYEDQKVKKLYAKLLGLWHFLLGKYGKHDAF